MDRYFVNTGDGIEYRNTEQDARRLAIRSLESWRERARQSGEWDDEADEVCWGRLEQVAIPLPASDDGTVDFVLSDKLPE
jgi:hypothetical protein